MRHANVLLRAIGLGTDDVDDSENTKSGVAQHVESFIDFVERKRSDSSASRANIEFVDCGRRGSGL